MSDQKQTTIIEIHGVKMEIDLRNAKRIDTLRVGDRVKCLVKGYSGMATHAGVIVGFEPFPSLPSIVVAYLDTGYASGTLKFQTFNSETKDFEVIADLDNNSLEVDKASILAQFNREEAKLNGELRTLQDKRTYFLERFGQWFSEPQVID